MIQVSRINVKSQEDFETIKEYWNRLENGKDMTVFQSYNWNLLLYEEWRNSKWSKRFSDIYIYIASSGIATEIFPAIVQRKSTKTKWTGREKGIYILGYGSYSDYLNIIYDHFSIEITNELINRIKSDFSDLSVHFSEIREDTQIFEYLKQSDCVLFDCGVAVSVKIEESVDAYTGLLSKHVKQNLRTAANRMKKDGIDYRLETKGIIQDKVLLDELLTVHINRMKTKNTSKQDLMHVVSSLIRKYIREQNERNNNIVYKSQQIMENSCCVIVKFGDKVVGYLYGFYDRDSVRIIQNCVDDNYGFYSPMFKGTYDFILSCYDHPYIREVDFTRGDEQYKYKLGGVEIRLFHFVK